MRENNLISVTPFSITRILGIIAFLLVLANIGGLFSKFVLGHGSLKGLVPLFILDKEKNIPTFFSVLLMLSATLLLVIITLVNIKNRLPHVSKWGLLSFGFLYMAFDEAFQFHERLTLPAKTLLNEKNLGIFYSAWVIPGIALVVFLGLFFLRFLLYLPAKTRFRFLMAATFYIGGAIGMECVGGKYFEIHGTFDLTYGIITTVEESLEITGLIFFIWALLKYCAENYKEVRFQFGG